MADKEKAKKALDALKAKKQSVKAFPELTYEIRSLIGETAEALGRVRASFCFAFTRDGSKASITVLRDKESVAKEYLDTLEDLKSFLEDLREAALTEISEKSDD